MEMGSLKRVLEDLTEPPPPLPPKKTKDMVKNLKDVIHNHGEKQPKQEFLSPEVIFFLDRTLLGSMMKIISKEIPDYEFARKHGEESPELYTIKLKEQFNEEQILNLSLKLQLNGAACVFLRQ
jgi:hypothetical protein